MTQATATSAISNDIGRPLLWPKGRSLGTVITPGTLRADVILHMTGISIE